jgi:hypothetical protein
MKKNINLKKIYSFLRGKKKFLANVQRRLIDDGGGGGGQDDGGNKKKSMELEEQVFS